MKVLNYKRFKTNLKKVLDTVIDDQETVIVNRGENNVVLLPLKEYNAWKETLYLLSSKQNRLRLEEAIERDRNRKY